MGTRNKTNQSKNKSKLSIDETEVKEVSTFKFLGITVNLTWNNHVDDLARKCSHSSGTKLNYSFPESALLSLYSSLFNVTKFCFGFEKKKKELLIKIYLQT